MAPYSSLNLDHIAFCHEHKLCTKYPVALHVSVKRILYTDYSVQHTVAVCERLILHVHNYCTDPLHNFTAELSEV